MTTMTTDDRVGLKPVCELIARQTRSTIPAVRLTAIRVRPRPAATKPAGERARLLALGEAAVKRLLYGLLALAAITGVAYGALSVVEHAQNWPVFNAWVGRIWGA